MHRVRVSGRIGRQGDWMRLARGSITREHLAQPRCHTRQSNSKSDPDAISGWTGGRQEVRPSCDPRRNAVGPFASLRSTSGTKQLTRPTCDSLSGCQHWHGAPGNERTQPTASISMGSSPNSPEARRMGFTRGSTIASSAVQHAESSLSAAGAAEAPSTVPPLSIVKSNRHSHGARL